ncbi:hypothetical protein PTTG_28100 [Puccinia triticina 1-1 BBBD Race 1]|uniref:Uncharacterized protein n=1 Tax=Puccinia triticina (isolate 1-1 / race 1 (BBBD)) TaxID=630390 RepID=A0A180GEB7_PUCT1|nr:hypothetical protein PTTG_28100 [Puccinia triticina 1-1 BBBD Race 1]
MRCTRGSVFNSRAQLAEVSRRFVSLGRFTDSTQDRNTTLTRRFSTLEKPSVKRFSYSGKEQINTEQTQSLAYNNVCLTTQLAQELKVNVVSGGEIIKKIEFTAFWLFYIVVTRVQFISKDSFFILHSVTTTGLK